MGRSREELFAAANKKRKEKKEQENTRFSGGSFEDVSYTALSIDADKVIRVVGNPLLVRDKPTDPKISIISMILADNDKKFRCIWPDKSDDPAWILHKIYDKIMSYEWDKVNNTRKYLYATSKHDLFRRVAKNNSDNQYESGWKPSKVVHLNVIDRHDMDWHRENKHYKILSKKASEYGDNIWYEPGVPEYLYTTIWDEVVEYSGDWHNYDIVVRKLKEKPWYAAFHAIDDRKKISESVKELIVEKDITEEELSWEGYNFDRLFPITSYSTIKAKLGKFIKKVDLEFDTDYYEELEGLVEIEMKEKKEAKETEEPKKTVVKKKEVLVEEMEDDDFEIEEEEKEEEIVEVKTRSRKPVSKKSSLDWEALFDGTYNKITYLGIESMTDEEKDMVIGVEPDGSFKYKPGLTLLKNPSSDFISPEEFHVDPLSGELFED